MAELPQIERSIELPADPADVWQRIVDGRFAEEWMGIRIDGRAGGDVIVPDKDTIGTVEEVIPGESITWSWRDPDGDPSQVTIELEPTHDGTRITVIERLLEYRITGTPPVFLDAA